MDGRFFLDVVIREGSVVFELLSGENKTLLVGWDGLFILDLVLEILYGVGWFHVQGDVLSSEGSNKDLHWRCGTKIVAIHAMS